MWTLYLEMCQAENFFFSLGPLRILYFYLHFGQRDNKMMSKLRLFSFVWKYFWLFLSSIAAGEIEIG